MGRIMGIIAVGLCILTGQASSAETWYVAPPPSGDHSNPGTEQQPFATIQKGIDSAADADTVIVAEGTYFENIHFDGKNIVLCSSDPLDPDVVEKTIIDGSQAGPVVTFAGTENQSCLLSGLTIRNGKADYGGGICGGTAENPTDATIQNNAIIANSAEHNGGGLCFCQGAIQLNTISGNSAMYGGGLSHCDGNIQYNTIAENSGGGLGACDGTVQYNIISDNSAIHGGGLSDCHGTIQRNTITGNSADGLLESSGGGLACCNATIDSNWISLNRAEWGGGGLYQCQGSIGNNVIVGNSVSVQIPPIPDRGYGGAFYGCDGTIWNNTVTNNSATYGGAFCRCRGTIINCIIWDNSSVSTASLCDSTKPIYSCIQGSTADGEGSTSLDPQFADSGYRPSPDSPCIDKGKNEEWMWGAVDLDGNPRVWRGTVDMGAYEHGSFPFKIIGVLTEPGGVARLTWNSRPGDTYTIWSGSDLSAENPWTTKERTIPSGGDKTTWTGSDTTSTRKFYRIEIEQ